MEELYNKLVQAGEYEGDLDSFKSAFGSNPAAQRELHGYLSGHENKYVTKPFEEWSGKYFASASPPGKSSATRPQEGDPGGSAVSPEQSGTASAPTPEQRGAFQLEGVGSQMSLPGDFFKTKQAEIGLEPQFQAPATTADDDIKAMLEKPTEQLLYDYIEKTSPSAMSTARSLREGGTLSPIEANAAKRTVLELNRLKADKTLSPEQKVVRAKRAVYNSMVQSQKEVAASGEKPLAFSPAFDLAMDLSRTETEMERADPKAYKEMMDSRLRENAVAQGYDEKGYVNRLMTQGIGRVYEPGTDQHREAVLALKRERMASDPSTTPEKLEQIDFEIEGFRQRRLGDLDAVIGRTEDLLDNTPGGEAATEIKDQIERLKGEREGLLNPSANAAKVYGQYREEIDRQPGDTPLQKMRRYYAELEMEREELQSRLEQDERGRLGGDIGSVVEGSDPIRDRYALVTDRMKAIAPVAYFNQPIRGTAEGAADAAGRGFTNFLMPGTAINTGARSSISDQERSAHLLEAMAVAGVDPSMLNAGQMEAINERTKGYGLGDLRFWTETAGTMGGIVLPMMVGGGALRATKIPQLVRGAASARAASAPRVVRALADATSGALEAGAAYELSGELFRNTEEELNFKSGLFGGFGSAAGRGMVKSAYNKVKGLFGVETANAVKIISDFGAQRAGSGVGETFEETAQELTQAWQRTENFDKWIGEIQKQFGEFDEAVKFFVSTFAMGVAMGGGHNGGLGQELLNNAQQQFEGMSPEQQVQAQEVVDAVREETVEVAESVAGEEAAEEGQMEEAQGQPAAQTGQEAVATEETTAIPTEETATAPPAQEVVQEAAEAIETPAAEEAMAEPDAQETPITEEQVTAAREAISRPVAEPQPGLAPDTPVSYQSGPRGMERTQEGVVQEIRPDGSVVVRIDVGGQQTTSIQQPGNLTRLDAPQGITEEQKAQGVVEAATPIGQSLAREAPDFEAWSTRMEETLGEEVRPYLPQIWEQAGRRPEIAQEATVEAGLTQEIPQNTPQGAPPQNQGVAGVDFLPPAPENYTPPAEAGAIPPTTPPSVDGAVPALPPDGERNRAFSERVASREETEGVHAEMSQESRTYKPRKKAQVEREAREYIAQHGPKGVYRAISESNEIPFDTKVKAAKALFEHYNEQARAAKASGDKKAEREALEDSVALAERLAEIGTMLGQGVNAFRGWESSMDVIGPTVVTRMAAREIDRARQRAMERNASTHEAVISAIEDGNSIAADEAVNNYENSQGQDPPQPKPKKKVFGQTKDQIKQKKAEALKKAKAAFNNYLSSGIASDPRAEAEKLKAMIDAVAEYGLLLVQEGVVSFTEWAGKIKSDLGDIPDDHLQDAWENDHNGRNLSSLAVAMDVANRMDAMRDRVAENAPAKKKKLDPVDEIMRAVSRRLFPTERGKPDPVAAIAEAVAFRDQYADVWEEARAEVKGRIDSDGNLSEDEKTALKEKLDKAMKLAFERPFTPNQIKNAVRQRLKAKGKSMRDITDADDPVSVADEVAIDLVSEMGFVGENADLVWDSIRTEIYRAAMQEMKQSTADRTIGRWGRQDALQAERDRTGVERRASRMAMTPANPMRQREKPDPARWVEQVLNDRAEFPQAWERARQRSIKKVMDNPALDEDTKYEMVQEINHKFENPLSEQKLRQIIAQEMKRERVTLRDIVQGYYTAREYSGTTLAALIAERLDVNEESAQHAAEAIQAEFGRLADKKKKQLLANRLGRDGRAYFDLVERSNYGMLSDGEFRENFERRMKLPSLTEEQVSELQTLAAEVVALPEGSIRARHAVKLMAKLADLTGPDWGGIAWSLYYAKILSGPTTHARNITGNLLNAISESFVSGIEQAIRNRDPLALLNSWKGLWDGMAKVGMATSMEALATGYSAKGQKMETPDALERMSRHPYVPGEGAWAKSVKTALRAIESAKYVSRALKAEDAVFYASFKEMRFRELARQLAIDENITGERAIRERTAELLGHRSEVKKNARIRSTMDAMRYGLNERQRRIREQEIVEDAYRDDWREEADRFASYGTFNYDPQGLLGFPARAMSSLKELPIGGMKFGRALNFIIPFTRVPMNILNQQLSYTPWGFMRLTVPWLRRQHGLTTKEQRRREFIKASLGMTALSMIAVMDAMFGDQDDEDEKGIPFRIHGNGPRDGAKRAFLADVLGWRPNSIQIGNNYVDFQNTPLAQPFAMYANFRDALRYGELDKTDAVNRLTYAFVQTGQAVAARSFLESVGELTDLMGTDNPNVAVQKFYKQVTKNFSPIPNAVNQIGQWFEPGKYSKDSFAAYLIDQIPVVRSEVLRKELNVFGEEIDRSGKGPLGFLANRSKPDELARRLASKNLWVKMPGKRTMLDGMVMTDDQYWEFVKTSGTTIKNDLIEDIDRIAKMPTAEAQKEVDTIVEDARKSAKESMGGGQSGDVDLTLPKWESGF